MSKDMKNILSQAEVDSLLAGIREGAVETETAVPEADEAIARYNFRRQDGPVTVRMPTLQMINERFVGMLRTELSAITRSVVDVHIASTESMTFGKFCGSVSLPASLNIFKVEPLRGFSLLVMGAKLVFSFVENFFGGRGVRQVNLEGRKFTSIETKIIARLVKIALGSFEQAWSDVYEIKATFTRAETDPQCAGIVTPNDMVVVIRLTVDLENSSGSMSLCIPHATLEPVRDKLRYRFQGEGLEADHPWRSYIERRIQELRVGVGCSLGTAQITGKELLEMKISDVLVLNQKVSDPIVITVEGVPKFKGYAGTYNKRKAIQIEGRLNRG
jgi:flagellar motor switch protein FliM